MTTIDPPLSDILPHYDATRESFQLALQATQHAEPHLRDVFVRSIIANRARREVTHNATLAAAGLLKGTQRSFEDIECDLTYLAIQWGFEP